MLIYGYILKYFLSCRSPCNKISQKSPTLLDSQKLMGKRMGKRWVLSTLSRGRHMWNQSNGNIGNSAITDLILLRIFHPFPKLQPKHCLIFSNKLKITSYIFIVKETQTSINLIIKSVRSIRHNYFKLLLKLFGI